MGKFLKNIYHELNDRLYVEFEPTQRPCELFLHLLE